MGIHTSQTKTAMLATVFAVFTVFTLSTIIFSTVATTSVLAQAAPPIYGIEIVDYESSAVQEPGTTRIYWAEVENIGLLELDPVYIRVSRIPEEWLEPGSGTALKFGERGRLYYNITIPENQAGYIVFSLDAWGEYGQLKASDSQPVVINITTRASEATATTTSTTVTTLTATTTSTTTIGIPMTIPVTNVTPTQIPPLEIPYADVIIDYADAVSGYTAAATESLTSMGERWPLQTIALALLLFALLLAVIRFKLI